MEVVSIFHTYRRFKELQGPIRYPILGSVAEEAADRT